MVYEAITEHKRKVTNEIRCKTNSGRNLWENVNNLRGKETKNKEIKLYDESGEELENGGFIAEEMKNFWSRIYQKHENNVGVVWNEEIKKNYIRELELGTEPRTNINYNTVHTMVFPEFLEEHNLCV